MSINCAQCGVEFVAKWSNQKFCSQSCSATHNNKGREATQNQKLKVSLALRGKVSKLKGRILSNGGVRLAKKCEKCGNEFVPERPRRRFCSSACWLATRGASDRGQISYRTFRKIIKRAFPNWKCPFCNWESTYDIHHINGRSSNDISDLVMLCPNHHSAVHHGLLSKDQLVPFAVGSVFTWEQLLTAFYGGNNKVVNHHRYATEKSKMDAYERSHAMVSSAAMQPSLIPANDTNASESKG